jgi:probable F420-dependent oxidoreductase
MSVPRRYGVTVPLGGLPLHEHKPWYEELVALGYTDLWSAEAGGHEGLVPLALAAAWTPTLRLGTAILPVYTRGAATLAEATASMCQAAPGRFALGIGCSSPTIVENWNAVPFEKPYQRVRDTIRFLRAALSGEKVTAEYETFSVKGFRLDVPIPEMPPILVAGLRGGMLRLAGREGDGAITNWLSPDDVPKIVEEVGPDKEIVARIIVLPTTDFDTVRAIGRRTVAAYLTVPAYAAFQEWLGRGDALREMNEAWSAGDRARALELVPDTLLDELIVHGTLAECARRVEEYAAAGITTTAPMINAQGDQAHELLRALAPNAA